MPDAPRDSLAGSVTFLFTDIEGSTRLWEQDAARMSQALAAHDALAKRAVESRGGRVVKMIGDGMHAVFASPLNAIEATIDLQRALASSAATAGVELRVRCGLHAGSVEFREGDYFGTPVNRAARIMSAAHGGQILVSQAVADVLGTVLRSPVSLRDLGNVRLKDLATPEHVYQLQHPDLRREFPALRSLEAIPNNLPQQSTSFIGREQELVDLERLLGKTRLLTLTGSGGCGKTRLALQVGADALEHYADGVWLVELASLSKAALVPQAVATVLGLREETGKSIPQTLADHLADKRALLILDNCEHLLEAAAGLVDLLLRRCPGLRIATTSREALGIAGEQSFRVPSLSLPPPSGKQTADAIASFEAVQLFVDRAALVRPGFALSDENAAPIASICFRLDGIPLAIELAAARVRTLSVPEIDARLNERFRLLTGGSRTALPRQQTLRSLIDWSYDLLNAPAKQMLQRLSVFAGGWTLEAAEHVCADDDTPAADVLDLLTSLADKSLVAFDAERSESRYRLVETVRQYAREKLMESGAGETVRDRHLDYFVTLAELAEPKLMGAEQTMWLRRLEDEHDNLRAALEWSVATDIGGRALRLCGALQRFWIMHGHGTEGRQWCTRVLSVEPSAAGTLARSKALNCAGLLAYHQLDYDEARRLLEESLAIRRAAGDSRGVAVSLNNLGMVALDQGDLAAARAMHEQSLALARELGNRNGIARSLGNLGMVASEQRDFGTARVLFEECLAIMRQLGDRDGTAIALHSLGGVACDQGQFDASVAYYLESLELLRELGHRPRITYSLAELARVSSALGDAALAGSLWGAAERAREELGMSPQTEGDEHAAQIAAARATLGGEAFDHAWHDGRALSTEQAVELAAQLSRYSSIRQQAR
jgi:predicted ATPase/class 3 adenylate cyclase